MHLASFLRGRLFGGRVFVGELFSRAGQFREMESLLMEDCLKSEVVLKGAVLIKFLSLYPESAESLQLP